VRRSREEAARTRRTAVAAASRLFRERGIEAASVSEVMASLGMTDGGFYRHFESKEALAAEACAAAFAESGLARESSASAKAVLRGYLSEAHRDAPGAGCPLPGSPRRWRASLRRCGRRTLTAFAARSRASGSSCPARGREARFALLAGMVGALALARAVDDEGLSAAILRGTRGFWTRSLEPPKT